MEKKKEYVISVMMDARIFQAFSFFDVFWRRKQLAGQIAFSALLFLGAGLCLWQRETREGALWMAGLLLVVAVCFPVAAVLSHLQKSQRLCQSMELDRPRLLYQITATAPGIVVSYVEDGERKEERWLWKRLVAAYRTRGALYLYATEEKAYLLPVSQIRGGSAEELWALCRDKMGRRAVSVGCWWIR